MASLFQRLFSNTRLLSLLFLGFASGLPLALTGSTLQAWLTQSGVNIVTIGALSLVGMPYVWKFLWAPVMDRFQLPFSGRRKGWILLTQLLLCFLLMVMANQEPSLNMLTVSLLALLVAFVSASQDVAVDAYRTDIMLPNERGMGVANFVFAYRMAMVCSSGIALVLADHFGWKATYNMMAFVMGLSCVVTCFIPKTQAVSSKPQTFYGTVTSAFKQLWERDAMLLTLVFIALYKLGDALVGSLTSNFLLRELGFSLTDVGLAFKTVGLLATIVGAYVGAFFLKRIGLYRGLWVFGLAQGLSSVMFMVLAIVGKHQALMVSTVCIESFCSGMSTTALFAFLTALCNREYSATQYACLSAVASLARVVVGPVAGVLVAHIGWVHFYGISSLLAFPAIFILSLLRSKVMFNAEAIA